MDSPLPFEETSQSAGADRSRGEPPKPLFAAPGLPDKAYIRDRDKRLTVPRSISKYHRRLAVRALSGATALAMLIYGAMRTGTFGQTGLTIRIPDAARIGAAVTNLPPPNFLKPVSPVEAVKENADRQFVDRPDAPASRFVLKTSGENRERAMTCLTQAVYYEAAGEGVDGGRAVAQVVLNRTRHPGYPASVCGVIYQGSDRGTGCQFTFTCDGSLLRPHLDSLWTRSRKIAQDALSGHVFAPVGHATHYHADYVVPYWADSLDKTAQIGRHIFYRLKGVYGDSRSFFQRYAGVEPPIPDPRPPVLAAPMETAAEEQQLAKTLIGEDSKVLANGAEKAAIANSPLLADTQQSTLIIGGEPSATTAKKKESSASCPAGERTRLSPLSANDMRAGPTSPAC
jgi:spore germination cell wall hydrolase CwlJ-like protein